MTFKLEYIGNETALWKAVILYYQYCMFIKILWDQLNRKHQKLN